MSTPQHYANNIGLRRSWFGGPKLTFIWRAATAQQSFRFLVFPWNADKMSNGCKDTACPGLKRAAANNHQFFIQSQTLKLVLWLNFMPLESTNYLVNETKTKILTEFNTIPFCLKLVFCKDTGSGSTKNYLTSQMPSLVLKEFLHIHWKINLTFFFTKP